MSNRHGDWIQTFSGRKFYPLDARPEEISLGDIAHALSMQCRFLGHLKHFYSVAQHSVLVSQQCAPKDALWGLLHDAAEAYLGDVTRPLKRSDEMAAYRAAEQRLMEVICTRFGLNATEPESVRRADLHLLLTERDQLLAVPPLPWGDAQGMVVGDYPHVPIVPLPPREAQQLFLERFYELTKR